MFWMIPSLHQVCAPISSRCWLPWLLLNTKNISPLTSPLTCFVLHHSLYYQLLPHVFCLFFACLLSLKCKTFHKGRDLCPCSVPIPKTVSGTKLGLRMNTEWMRWISSNIGVKCFPSQFHVIFNSWKQPNSYALFPRRTNMGLDPEVAVGSCSAWSFCRWVNATVPKMGRVLGLPLPVRQPRPRCAHTVILQKAPTQHLCLRVFMLTFLLLRPASSVTKQYISFRKLFVQQTLLGARSGTVALDSCRHGWQWLSFKSSPLLFHKQAEVEGGSPRTAAWAPTFNCVCRFVIFVLSYTPVWKAWLFSFLGHYRFRIEQRTGRMVGLEEHWSSQTWQMPAGEKTGKLYNAYQGGVSCTPGPFRGGKGQIVAYQLSSGTLVFSARQ